MHPATRRNIPPIDNQRRGLDKAVVGDGDGTGEAEGNSTAIRVAAEGALSGRSVLVSVEVKGSVNVGTAVAAGITVSVADGGTVGAIVLSPVAVAVAEAVEVTVTAGSAV
jgi:hypothetical protein